MMTMTAPRTMLFLTSCLLAMLTGLAQTPSVTQGYNAPRLTVPYAWQPPIIDGAVGDAEWHGACSISALQTTGRQVSTRQTRFWITWDNEHLYIAMRSPLRKGERLVQALRDRGIDINVVFDDAYEIFLDAGTKSADGQPCYFQYLGNYAGARYDVMFEPAVGNSRLGYTSGWEPKHRITPDGSAWEMEVAVPRESLFLKTPFTDGAVLRSLFARDYKRPWEQNSVEGTGNFAMRDTYSTLVLSKSAPAIHLLGVADPVAQTLGLSLAAFGRQAGQLHWRFDSEAGLAKDGTLDLLPNTAVTMAALNLESLTGAKPANNFYRIRVLSPDNTTVYLDWCAKRAFGGDMKEATREINDRGDAVSMRLTLNPVKDYLRVTADFINFDARAQVAKCDVAVVDAAGKPLASRSMQLDNLAYVRDVLPLGQLPPGQYTATLAAIGKDGTVLASQKTTFDKKDPTQAFPWWNTTAGNTDKIQAPWTPVTAGKKHTYGVWGRTMQVGPGGLPAQVTSQGQALLAAPVALVAELTDGKTVRADTAKVKTVTQSDSRTVAEVKSAAGKLNVSSRVTVEYDGMYKVEMTITPAKPTAVKSLKVLVPLRNEVAEFYHGAGEGIRYGFSYGFVPATQTGRLWDSRTVEGQPMAVGSFIPFVWVGNDKGGLCWYANSDEGWMPNNDVPAIELRRDGTTSTDLVLNLISAPATLDAPRTVVFAFQATPVKAMRSKWRVDNWWCGNTFFDFCGVERAGGSLIWSSLPFSLDNAKAKQLADQYHKGTPAGGPLNPAVPYWEYNSFGPAATDAGYFNEQWRLSDGEGFWFDKSFTDYVAYNLYHWAMETGIDGWYLDNVRPVACAKIEAGRGYRLPDDRVQPVFSTFETRDFFLRIRAAFIEAGREPWIVAHMTNNYMVCWPWDFAYDGEHNVIYPESGKDFMDLWSLDRLRLAYGGQWGVSINFMQEYQGDWGKDQVRYQQALRAFIGMTALFDMVPSGNTRWMSAYNTFKNGRLKFGLQEDDVTFRPYWHKTLGVRGQTDQVLASAWLRSDKVLLLVANLGEKTTATLTLDAKALGLGDPATWTVSDAEAGGQMACTDPQTGKLALYPKWNPALMPITRDGATLTVPIDRHNYRQIIIETAAK
jgi:hypothetical protein